MLSPCAAAKRDQSAKVRAVNRQNSKYFRKKPTADRDRRWVFSFSALARLGALKQQEPVMITINTNKSLSDEEKLVALTHIYLELRLSLQAAREAAEADLALLDASELVTEAT
jgi:hypothetical protein